MTDDGRSLAAPNTRQIPQDFWLGNATSDDRNVSEIAQSVHPVLRRLGYHRIAHALGAQPEAGCGLEAGGKSDQRIASDVRLGETHVLGLGPVHINFHQRLVQCLLDVYVRCPRNLADAGDHLIGYVVISRHVRAYELNVNGRWKPEVQNLADNVRRLEEELCARELLRKVAAKIADVFERRTMLGIQ